jgi:heme o synthase
MSTTAIPLSRPQLSAWFRSTARVPDFAALMKPRVMALAVFTAFVGLAIAPGRVNPFLASIAILGIAVGAGAAGALNMWYDADIDAVMARTARRPIPRGRISRAEALVFGLVLAGCAVTILALAVNIQAAGLLAFTIFFYIAVYTAWLKRSTPQNIVIGGAAGALPPVIGWVAATGNIGLEPLILFLIIFLWTPPHFWALALNKSDDYARAGIPMLPVMAGRAATKRNILAYSALLVAASLLPWALGFAATFYGIVAAVSGALFVVLALRLWKASETDRRAAQRLFAFSIVYLFLLFAALWVSDCGKRWLSTPPASAASTVAGSLTAGRGAGPTATASSSVNFPRDEV